MPNLKNLKPFPKGYRPSDEVVKRGGYASGEARRKTKLMREMLEYLLEKEVSNSKGEKATTLEAISVAILKQAMNGSVRAYNTIRDTIGQKPIERVEQTNINVETKPEKMDIEKLKKIRKEVFGIDD